MPTIKRTQYTLSDDGFGLGRRLYRIFLLAVLLGVLWVKGYLWSAFIIALLLYLYDAILIPALTMRPIEIVERDDEPEEEDDVPRTTPRRGRGRWKWKPEDPP